MTGTTIPTPAVPDRRVPRRQGTVLVVDDDEGIRSLFLDLFRPEGVPIRVVGSGQEALSMVKQTVPALLIIDVLLPGEDGIAVLEEAQLINSRMMAVVMSGAASVELAVRALHTAYGLDAA